jgi:hypothetical protein
MADINLTQAEADMLIAMEKQRTDSRVLIKFSPTQATGSQFR